MEELKGMCEEYYADVYAHGYDGMEDGDLNHHIFEKAMQVFLGKDVWDILNARDTELTKDL